MNPTAALSGYYFAYCAYVGAYSPYITLYLKALGISAAQIGFLYSIPQVMRIFGPTLWGQLADRTGAPVPILRLATMIALGGFGAVWFGTSFAWLFCAFVVLHFFTSAQMPLVEAITLDHVRDAPGRYGRIRLWGSIGYICSVLGLGYLLDHVSEVAVLVVVTSLLAAVMLMAWLMPAPRQHVARHEDGGSVAEVLRRGEVRAFFAAGMLNAFAHAALYTFFSLYLIRHGYSKATVGWMWSLGVIIEVGVFHYLPQLTRRFDLTTLYFSSFVACAVRFLLIAWAVDNLWLLIIAQLLHASTFAIYHSSAVALVSRYFGPSRLARGQALYISLTFGLGGFIGATVSGELWERVGPAWTYTASAAAGLAGMLIFWRYRRSLPA
ncbi:MAG TPA: MFS transporter [Burkholderiales bacterium]|nr:MFS transporter [Burkholderiales bacterium]